MQVGKRFDETILELKRAWDEIKDLQEKFSSSKPTSEDNGPQDMNSCVDLYWRVRQRLLKANANKKSRKRWIADQEKMISAVVDSMSREFCEDVLKKVANSRGYLIVCKADLMLEIADCIALRDYVDVGTNGLKV